MQRRKAAADVFLEQNMPAPAAAAPMQSEAPEMQMLDALARQAPGGGPYQYQEHAPSRSNAPLTPSGLKTSEELQLEKEPIRVRETGALFWRRVIVPPNVYVVHTRIGREKPVTLGLGCSFRYNPDTDAYLVVPAAMQTIGIVANCISREKQGINVLAYVQWQIADFAVAYKKLDFSDMRDPLGIVNAQLREQAEAAIKDKIATMSVEDVLTDKQPIIAELTTRLKTVAEGRDTSPDDEGLGIKIVTVQIKEALVSSKRLWENLQAPFRHEQDKGARISLLEAEDAVRQKELETRRIVETSEAETRVEIARITQTKETEAVELRLIEEARRLQRENEHTRQTLQWTEQTALAQRESAQRLELQAAEAKQAQQLAQLRRAQAETVERARLAAEAGARQKALQVEQALQELSEATRLAERQAQAELERLTRETAVQQQTATFQRQMQDQAAELTRVTQEADLAALRRAATTRQEIEEADMRLRLLEAEKQAELMRLHQEARNALNERALAAQFIERLPEIAAHMPKINDLRVVQTGGGTGTVDVLGQFLAQMLAVVEGLGVTLRPPKPPAT